MTAADQKKIEDIQSLVDEIRKTPGYGQYVEQRKLALIDSSLAPVDRMLEAGLIK
jgi:hypothetical protein